MGSKLGELEPFIHFFVDPARKNAELLPCWDVSAGWLVCESSGVLGGQSVLFLSHLETTGRVFGREVG